MIPFPSDVWLEIILQVVDTSPLFPIASSEDQTIASGYSAQINDRDREVKHSARPLAGVCSSWRSLVHGCSRCWVTSTYIPILQLERGFSFPLLEKSRGSDIVAAISCYPRYYEETTKSHRVHVFKALVSLLKKYRKQWLAITFYIPGELLRAVKNLPFPRLRSLTFGMRGSHGGPPNLTIQAPELQFVRLALQTHQIPFHESFRSLEVLSICLPRVNFGSIPLLLSSLDSVRDLNLCLTGELQEAQAENAQDGFGGFQPPSPFLPRLQRLWLEWSGRPRWPRDVLRALGPRTLALLSCKTDGGFSDQVPGDPPSSLPSPKCIQWEGHVYRIGSLPFNSSGTSSLLVRGDQNPPTGDRIVRSGSRGNPMPALAYLQVERSSGKGLLELLAILNPPNLFRMKLDICEADSDKGMFKGRYKFSYPSLRELAVTLPTARHLGLLELIDAPALARLEVREQDSIHFTPLWENRLLRAKGLLGNLVELNIPDGSEISTILELTPKVHTLGVQACDRATCIRSLVNHQPRLMFWRNEALLLPELKLLDIEYHEDPGMHDRTPESPTGEQKERSIWKEFTKRERNLVADIRSFVLHRRSYRRPLQKVGVNVAVSALGKRSIRATGVDFREKGKARPGAVRWVSFF